MNDLELIKRYVPTNLQEDAIKKLEQSYPVQYIIGNVDFYGYEIKVNENVLIPRFETEYLVEKTIKYLEYLNIKKPNILEIGTGSGCISIALKKEIDCFIKEEALLVALENATNNNVSIDFELCDIHKFSTSTKYDLIISNPPYVPVNSKVDEKTKYEPKEAIFASEEGIHYYKVILERLHNNLSTNYLIAFEIDNNEGNLIKEVVKKYLPNSYIKIEKDYNNLERYIFISNKNILL